MARKESLANLEFRPWQSADIADCAKIESWPPTVVKVPAEFDAAFIELYLRRSTWAQTVTAAGQPIGLLFARVNSDMKRSDWLGASLAGALTYVRTALGRLGPIPNRLTLLKKLVATESKAKWLQPKTDGEITLLFLAPQYQGRGIGRTLVNNFLEEARHKGVRCLTVVTGEDSNWRFYERLGFRRVKAFYDDFDSYLMKERIRSFIYFTRL